ncbi:hypothetical protein FLA105534_02048 [Flavobacterium bizetiae]|uniref:Uncharacterized protein n=1 Tax=Flavobacterium bizetiae TaxID=2704140 RepID=A0A6J4GGC4_9FLAO|nr:hypothetical protein [Flavobacterium bizetiae]CAA9198272.1 hypothetical protein FLA105534_02048 [Flavobacterium bizetiae]CAD5343547.1 hypothetical protein FLA105535_03546 [Flavobacterium bizetiae]CAD5349541.1 hypothetical protein FLA105534_03526 [Flavobacterium bizetiae]
MKEKQKKNFVKVSYNLLATTKLSSTQKLFVSYILGWQKNGKVCFETNNTLASKFGKKYGGIRSVLRELNKHDFFKSVKKDYDEKTGTSGHEITVNIDKLDAFLADETSIQNINSTEQEVNQTITSKDSQNEDSNEEVSDYNIETNTRKLSESILTKHQLGDTISVYDILGQLGYEEPDDVLDFIHKANSTSMDFQKFISISKNLHIEKQHHDYKGIIISDKVLTKINKMIQV